MHSCPICGSACYCGGDLEDHGTGPEFEDACTCCEEEEAEPNFEAWLEPPEATAPAPSPPWTCLQAPAGAAPAWRKALEEQQ
jgi:hypothetical protein